MEVDLPLYMSQWMRWRGEMDADGDGRLSLSEFRERTYDIYKNFPDFDNNEINNPQFHSATAEKRFLELDVNKDKFLTTEELKPIIHQLHLGELSYATYYTKYLMHEGADIMEHIDGLRQKVVDISRVGKQVVADSENVIYEDGKSSESVTNITQLGEPQDYDDSSDTSLKLGVV